MTQPGSLADLAERYVTVVNRGDVSQLEELIGEVRWPAGEASTYLQHMKDVVIGLRASMPDLVNTPVKVLESADGWVTVHSVMTGTHTGAPMPEAIMRAAKIDAVVPASGRRMEVRHTHILRFEGGKAVEFWHVIDWLQMFQTLGFFPNRDD